MQNNKMSHSLESKQTEKQTDSKENRKTQNGPVPNCSEGFYSDGLNWKDAKAGNSTNLTHRSENKSRRIREYTALAEKRGAYEDLFVISEFLLGVSPSSLH